MQSKQFSIEKNRYTQLESVNFCGLYWVKITFFYNAATIQIWEFFPLVLFNLQKDFFS